MTRAFVGEFDLALEGSATIQAARKDWQLRSSQYCKRLAGEDIDVDRPKKKKHLPPGAGGWFGGAVRSPRWAGDRASAGLVAQLARQCFAQVALRAPSCATVKRFSITHTSPISGRRVCWAEHRSHAAAQHCHVMSPVAREIDSDPCVADHANVIVCVCALRGCFCASSPFSRCQAQIEGAGGLQSV